MTKTTKKAVPSKATRRTAAKKAAAPKLPAPIKISNPKTACAAGYLMAVQQATQLLHDSRSFADAIQRLQAIEKEISQRAHVEVVAELASAGIDPSGYNFSLQNTESGPHINLVQAPKAEIPAFPAEVQAQIAAAERAMTAEKEKKATAPARRTAKTRSTK